MDLKRHKQGWLSKISIGKWKIWILVATIATSLLLSSCSDEVTDYRTDLGDPSLYKEFYNKVKRENIVLSIKLDSLTKENSKLKARNAALQAQKVKDINLSQREQALDEWEKMLSEREEQLKRSQEIFEDVRSQLNEKTYQEGIKAGLLKKDEEQIQDLKKDLRNIRSQARFSILSSIVLLFSILALLAYIFLDKYGVLKAIAIENFPPGPKTIDAIKVSDISLSKASNAGAMEDAKDSHAKALPSENDGKPNDDQSIDNQSPA